MSAFLSGQFNGISLLLIIAAAAAVLYVGRRA